MASCSSFDVALLSGKFDLQSVSVYNLISLGRYVINNDDNTYNFCCEIGLLAKSRNCDRCRRLLKLCAESRADRSTPYIFRCTNKACRKDKFSVRDGTVFQASKLLLQQILTIINLFTARITDYEQIQYQTQQSAEHKLSTETVVDWLSYCREICLEIVARQTSQLIGGPGLTVEVDESKFGKRKYNKGRLVEGQWVVGSICRETGEIFLAPCPDNKRDAPTLLDIIERHVHKQSVVITDCWKAYDQLDDHGWQHNT